MIGLDNYDIAGTVLVLCGAALIMAWLVWDVSRSANEEYKEELNRHKYPKK